MEKIRAPLYAVNSADDFIDPPELGILEREIKRVPKGACLPAYRSARKLEATVPHDRSSLEAAPRRTAESIGEAVRLGNQLCRQVRGVDDLSQPVCASGRHRPVFPLRILSRQPIAERLQVENAFLGGGKISLRQIENMGAGCFARTTDAQNFPRFSSSEKPSPWPFLMNRSSSIAVSEKRR